MDIAVNWQYLSEAIAFYQDRGYEYVEVPWMVDFDTVKITLPPSRRLLPGLLRASEDFGVLVGSAEQSFLQLELDGKLTPGRYVACSPCFRYEPTLDTYHRSTFMKVELYQNYAVNERSLRAMIHDAERFFASVVQKRLPYSENIFDHLVREKTEDGIDLVLNGVEVGSYGGRRHNHLEWVYGTGVAEPRLSTVLKSL